MKSNEVKFRVWDNESKEYNKDKEVLLSSDNKIYRIHTITGELQQLHTEHLEVEFWTGFKDSKGNEIYEGDILKCWNDENYKAFIIKTSSNAECFTNTFVNTLLIGNIHENPELLKEKE